MNGNSKKCTFSKNRKTFLLCACGVNSMCKKKVFVLSSDRTLKSQNQHFSSLYFLSIVLILPLHSV